MNNKEAEDNLNEEVKQMEILKFIDEKYNEVDLITQRTLQRWLDELNIECIQPRPKRNKDIRYRKADVLKLEKIKRQNLSRKKSLEEERSYKRQIAKKDREKEIEYYSEISNMTNEEVKQEDIDQMFNFDSLVEKKIKEDKLDMCFNRLFPNVEFDKKLLEKNFLISNNPDMFSEEEYSNAILSINKKKYIKENTK